jgi:hypothetical protein
METILEKYNISESRSNEIYQQLEKMEDFPIETSKEDTLDKILSYLHLVKINEICFIKAIVDFTIQQRNLLLFVN